MDGCGVDERGFWARHPEEPVGPFQKGGEMRGGLIQYLEVRTVVEPVALKVGERPLGGRAHEKDAGVAELDGFQPRRRRCDFPSVWGGVD